MKRLLFALLISAACAAGCKSSRVETAGAPPPAATAEAPAPAAPAQPPAVPEGAELVKLTIKVPPEVLSSRGGARRGGHKNCPQSQLQERFGISFSRPHGCLVGGVARGSLGEQAGLKAGDSITECNGDKVTCPSSLLQRLPLGKEPGLIELTIVRPKAPAAAPPAP